MLTLNRAVCLFIIEFWEWFTFLTYKSSARYMMCKYFLSVCSLNFHSLKSIFYKADLSLMMPKLSILLKALELNIKPLSIWWNTTSNHFGFVFIFVFFACSLPPVDFHLQSLQSGLTSFQMDTQLSCWNFLHISSCLFLLPHFSVGSLFRGPHILVLYVSPPFGGDHFPIGLSARVNGRHSLKPQISENIIGATPKNI